VFRCSPQNRLSWSVSRRSAWFVIASWTAVSFYRLDRRLTYCPRRTGPSTDTYVQPNATNTFVSSRGASSPFCLKVRAWFCVLRRNSSCAQKCLRKNWWKCRKVISDLQKVRSLVEFYCLQFLRTKNKRLMHRLVVIGPTSEITVTSALQKPISFLRILRHWLSFCSLLGASSLGRAFF